MVVVVTDDQVDAEFFEQCLKASHEVTKILFKYPKGVALYTATGVLASVAQTLKFPQDVLIENLKELLETLDDKSC